MTRRTTVKHVPHRQAVPAGMTAAPIRRADGELAHQPPENDMREHDATAHYAAMRDRLPRVTRSLALRGYACVTAGDPQSVVTLHLTADECDRLADQLRAVAASLRPAPSAEETFPIPHPTEATRRTA